MSRPCADAPLPRRRGRRPRRPRRRNRPPRSLLKSPSRLSPMRRPRPSRRLRRRPPRGNQGPGAVRCTASCLTGRGISCGSCARTPRTIWRSTAMVRCSSPPATRGKSIASPAIPVQPTLVARALVQQVTSLLADRAGGMLFATSNPGKLFRLSAARAARGTYTSDVRDAEASAAWGASSGRRWSLMARRSRSLPDRVTQRRPMKPGATGARLTPTRLEARSRVRARDTCSGARCWPPSTVRRRS